MLKCIDKAGAVVGVCFFGFAFGLPAGLWAKSFKGMKPGKTTREQVIDKFGDPTKSFSKGGELSDGISYQGDEAIEGASEADFYFDKQGVLLRIDVYPAREVTRAQVVRIFGKDYEDRKTSDGVRFIDYRKRGLTVFFERDVDRALVFRFTRGAAGKGSASRW